MKNRHPTVEMTIALLILLRVEFTLVPSFRAERSEVEKSLKILLNPVQRFLHFAADEKSARYSRNDDRSINSSSSGVYSSYVISSGAQRSREIF